MLTNILGCEKLPLSKMDNRPSGTRIKRKNMTSEHLKLTSTEIANNGLTGDQKLTLWITDSGMEWIETNGDPCTENEEGFSDLVAGNPMEFTDGTGTQTLYGNAIPTIDDMNLIIAHHAPDQKTFDALVVASTSWDEELPVSEFSDACELELTKLPA